MNSDGPTQPRVGRLVRTLVGLVLAPLSGAAIVSVGLFLGLGLISGGPIQGLLSGSVAATGAEMIAVRFGVIPALVLGWPVHLALLGLRWTQPGFYVALGCWVAIVGVIVATLGFHYMPEYMEGVMSFYLYVPGGASGAIGGYIFWLIRRPDRDFISA